MLLLALACADLAPSKEAAALADTDEEAEWEVPGAEEEAPRGNGVTAVLSAEEDLCPLPPDCVGMAEAMNRDLARIRYDDTLLVHNQSPSAGRGEVGICHEPWYAYISNSSQDSFAGMATWGEGPWDTEIAPGQTWEFAYSATDGVAWWCMERSQYTTSADDFWFIGAQAPPPLRYYADSYTDVDDDGEEDHHDRETYNDAPVYRTQLNAWDYVATNPVIAVGRDWNYLPMQPGEEREVTLYIVNIGRDSASVRAAETVPAGQSIHSLSDEPYEIIRNEDGSTTYWFAFKLFGAEDGADSTQASYPTIELRYTLRLEGDCAGRVTGHAPIALWSDAAGTDWQSEGSPMVVECCPELAEER